MQLQLPVPDYYIQFLPCYLFFTINHAVKQLTYVVYDLI